MVSLIEQPSLWFKAYRQGSVKDNIDLVMQALDEPMTVKTIRENDFGGLIVEFKDTLVHNKNYDAVLNLIEKMRKKHPMFYEQEYPYISTFAVKYHLFHDNIGQVDDLFTYFRRDPVKGIDMFIPQLYNLQFYLQSDLALTVVKDIYEPIHTSPGLIGGSSLEFAETIFHDRWQKVYEQLKHGESVDWEEVKDYLDQYGYEEDFRANHFDNIKNTLTAIFEGRCVMNDAEQWDKRFREDRQHHIAISHVVVRG